MPPLKHPWGELREAEIIVNQIAKQRGKAGWLLLWLVGVPVPVLIFLFLIRGCT